MLKVDANAEFDASPQVQREVQMKVHNKHKKTQKKTRAAEQINRI